MKGNPMTRKLQKSLQSGSKLIAKSLTKETSSGKRKAVAAAGIALVGAAGVASAVHMRRKKLERGTTFYVQPSDEGWVVTEGNGHPPLDTFETKKAAVEAGRKRAREAAPSELVVHGTNGSTTASHRYIPA